MTMRYPGMAPTTAREHLAELGVAPGSTVYVVQRHVSASGMTRWLSLFIIRNGELRDVTAPAAALFGESIDSERHALKVTGCGMDMHFHTVYRLARVLFYTDSRMMETDPGYALNHRTL